MPHVQNKLLQSRCSSLSVAFHPFGHDTLIFSGRLPHLQSSEEAGRKSLTCGVIGGIEGQSFENEGCMMRELKRLAAEQEILAEKSGLNLAPELHKLETSNDFVKFASKHGYRCRCKEERDHLLESKEGKRLVGVFYRQAKVQEEGGQACHHYSSQSYGYCFRKEVKIEADVIYQ